MVTYSVGDMVKFCGRIAEVIEKPPELLPWIVVSVVDAGGRLRQFAAPPEKLQPPVGEDETSLDALALITQNTSPLVDSSFLTAEVWLADPRAGDVFEGRLGEEVELVELHESGPIEVEHRMKCGPPTGHKARTIVFPSLTALQKAYELRNAPGYYLRAVRSKRGKTPPVPGGNSPL